MPERRCWEGPDLGGQLGCGGQKQKPRKRLLSRALAGLQIPPRSWRLPFSALFAGKRRRGGGGTDTPLLGCDGAGEMRREAAVTAQLPERVGILPP